MKVNWKLEVVKKEEREEGVLRRRARQRNDHDIELTKLRRTAHAKMDLSGDRAVENDKNKAPNQEVEDVICEEIENTEKPNTGWSLVAIMRLMEPFPFLPNAG